MGAVLLDTVEAVRAFIARERRSGSVGFVPTMGALHAGHARLIEHARRECALVVVSIFVNPLQFDREDDLREYPRTLDADRAFCDELRVDCVFAPDVTEVYPVPPQCTVEVARLADHLCGRTRKDHFRAVATIVLKLLQIIQPQRAYFGEKDAQQLAIVRRLVSDFSVPVTVVEVPTAREADGLALSSRNRLLSADDRRLATALYSALREADRQIRIGVTDTDRIKQAALARVSIHPALRLEYLEIVDPDEMQPVATVAGPVRVAAALWVGRVRLIDNLLSIPGQAESE
jgi:pantoate--beta-alanine ligase